MSFAKDCRSTVIPGMHYYDADAMIGWLCRAFSFEKHAVYKNADGTVMHAELIFGNGMIMLGTVQKVTPYSVFATTPRETNGREARSISLIVADCDSIYASAKAAGAEMIFDLEEKPYGGKGFACRDPEGYIWNIGSYDPWAHPPHV